MLVAIKDQTVVSPPLICVDDTAPPDKSHDNRPYFCPSRVSDNLGIDPAVAPEDAEYGNLGCAPSPPAFISAAEVAFIQFNLTLKSPVHGLLISGNLFSEKVVISVNCVAVDAGYSGCLGGG